MTTEFSDNFGAPPVILAFQQNTFCEAFIFPSSIVARICDRETSSEGPQMNVDIVPADGKF